MKKKHGCLICNFTVFTFLFISISSTFFSVFLYSCSFSANNPLLLCADSIIETRPDSALVILESISSPQKMLRADRALYALLLTQARHKNYIALEDDSLIKTAVEYYGDRKKSVRAAKAHYYWGAFYREKGYTSSAVEEYLVAIRLMPVRDEFLAMIYDNLAECYEEDQLDNVAMEAYRAAYKILKGKREQIYPLRGVARIFLLQNMKDSALCYYQKALDCALVDRDSNLIGAIYHDLAMVYNEKKDYIQADKYVSKAISIMNSEMSANACLLKAEIMLSFNKLDSANYYYSKNIDQLDICGKVVCYNGLYQVAKEKGEWEVALQNVDIYKILYDSIQKTTDNVELNRLMDKHHLEEHKRKLSEHTKALITCVVTIFISLLIVCVFCFMWNDRKRKKRYITLQHKLTQKRVDTMILKEEVSETNKEHISKKMSELREQQFQLCVSVFQNTDYYNKLETWENATHKQLLAMRSLRAEMNAVICKTFIDVMKNMQECCPALTHDDLFYCILSKLHCSKTVVMELMDTTSDAIKTRKNRIKNKMDAEMFEYVFNVDNL